VPEGVERHTHVGPMSHAGGDGDLLHDSTGAL
jgi:hypothetical protein